MGRRHNTLHSPMRFPAVYFDGQRTGKAIRRDSQRAVRISFPLLGQHFATSQRTYFKYATGTAGSTIQRGRRIRPSLANGELIVQTSIVIVQ